MTIGTIKNRLARKFRGTSLDDIEGISDYSIFEEAGGNVLSLIDPFETVRLYRFNQFDGIYDYAAPSYLKGKKVIDPRPQDERNFEDFTQTFIKDFDLNKRWKNSKISVEYQDGIKVLRLAERGLASLAIDDTVATTGWSAAGGATNLELDEIIKLDGSKSLRVDIGIAGGYIEKSTLDAVDMTDFTAASFFRRIYLPTAVGLTSITLRIGSASGDYYSMTGTPQIGAYRAGMNIVRFDLEGVAPTGAPDIAAIDYERLIFANTAAIADVRVGPMTAKLPTPYEVPLYADQIFRDETGVWLDQIEDEDSADRDDVVVVLDRDAENLFFYEVCVLVAEDLSLDEEAEKFRKKLYGNPGKDDDGGLYGQYKRDKPAEALRPQTRYIDLGKRRRGATRRRGIR